MTGSDPSPRLGSDPGRVATWLVAGWLVAGCAPSEVAWQPVEPPVEAPDFSLAALGGGGGRRVGPPVEAPDFSLAALDGGDVRLSELRGRVVVMEFWATWCGPCRYSSPSLEVMYRKYRDRGVTILLVNQAESPEEIRAWAEGRFTAPMLLDAQQAVARQYRVTGLPTLFIIDQQGMIRYHEAGDGGGVGGGLEPRLEGFFGELAAG